MGYVLKNADKQRFDWLTSNKYIRGIEKLLLANIEIGNIGSILEVGCGEGANIYNFNRDEERFVGIDIVSEKLNFASQILNKTAFVCADALNIPFKDNSFSLVFCRDVLHHVQNKNKTIEEMIRVCSPKGKIIILEASAHNMFWNIFGTVCAVEKAVKKNTISEFKRLLLDDYAEKFIEITVNTLYTPMLPRLLAHYKFGFKNLGNNKYFLVFLNVLNYFNFFSMKRYWPYIIASGIKK